MDQRGRGAVGTVLGLAILVLLMAVGYQLWTGRTGGKPPDRAVTSPGSPASSASVQPSGSSPTPSAPPVAPPGGQVRVAEPGELPASAHASLLAPIQKLIVQGSEAEAEARLMALPPGTFSDPRMRHDASVLWNNLGVLKSKARGASAGVSAFKTALSLDPENPTVRLNLAHAYWELKDPALTTEFLEKTIAVAPNDPLPHLVLADRLFEKDDLTGAALHLDQAAQRAAENPGLLSYLELVRAKVRQAEQAEQTFSSRGSSHFTVKFDGREDYDTWTRVLDILEEAYRDIGQKFGYFPTKPILVVLHTRESFHGATGSPAWADGLYDHILGRIKIPTQGALTDRTWLTRVLRHEFVHALLHERMGDHITAVPTWLNEGLAMQLAGDPWPEIEQVVRGDITLFSLRDLEGNWLGLPATAATVAYLEGNSATLYLIDRFGMEKVREIIGLLATGQSFAPAMHDRLFMSYDEFERRWMDNLSEKMKAGKP
ncbi:MAG: peptidase MA family metallohydrolase [Nitrospiraceae bacterium]